MSSYSRPKNSERIAFLAPHEQRLALAGLMLAIMLLAMLISVINDNVAQAQSTRDVAERRVQERGRCNAIQSRREREQCLLDLRLGDQAQAQVQAQMALR